MLDLPKVLSSDQNSIKGRWKYTQPLHFPGSLSRAQPFSEVVYSFSKTSKETLQGPLEALQEAATEYRN